MITEEQLQKVASMLIKAYRTEIIKDGDWWFGIDDYDFNIHDGGDFEGTGYFNINVYEHNGKGMSDYSHWFDLDPVFIGVRT